MSPLTEVTQHIKRDWQEKVTAKIHWSPNPSGTWGFSLSQMLQRHKDGIWFGLVGHIPAVVEKNVVVGRSFTFQRISCMANLELEYIGIRRSVILCSVLLRRIPPKLVNIEPNLLQSCLRPITILSSDILTYGPNKVSAFSKLSIFHKIQCIP